MWREREREKKRTLDCSRSYLFLIGSISVFKVFFGCVVYVRDERNERRRRRKKYGGMRNEIKQN